MFRSVLPSFLCLCFAVSVPADAQEKIRIAIWEVDNNAATSWALWNEMGPAARNHIDTEFSEHPTLAAKFAIVERSQLDLVMKEQGLAASGAVPPQTAAKVGSLLGVKYIVAGGIDKFAINDTKAGFGRIGGNVQQAEAAINLRFVDTTTGERLLAVSGEAEVRKGDREAGGLRDRQDVR
jgi:curli biogenesis system outer membrane secretion channel CsgG